VAQSPEALRLALPALIEDASNELPGIARLALQRAHLHWVDYVLARKPADVSDTPSVLPA